MLYYIKYSGGHCVNEEVIDENNLEDALTYAYYRAIEEYESYQGSGGIRSLEDIINEDFVEEEMSEEDYEEAEDIYREEVEFTISYFAEPYSRNKHGDII